MFFKKSANSAVSERMSLREPVSILGLRRGAERSLLTGELIGRPSTGTPAGLAIFEVGRCSFRSDVCCSHGGLDCKISFNVSPWFLRKFGSESPSLPGTGDSLPR